jgi:hypothetical protein
MRFTRRSGDLLSALDSALNLDGAMPAFVPVLEFFGHGFDVLLHSAKNPVHEMSFLSE